VRLKDGGIRDGGTEDNDARKRTKNSKKTLKKKNGGKGGRKERTRPFPPPRKSRTRRWRVSLGRWLEKTRASLPTK
jgi:hypothetical protein